MNTRILAVVLVVILIALGVYAFVRSNDRDEVTITPEPTSFEECAGRYPVMETSPRRCVTPGGVGFTEAVAQPTPTPTQPDYSNEITVSSPTKGQKITSPLTITGSARGPWYFEASFPIELRNSANVVIAQGHAEAQSDWMTTDFVPYKTTLTFPAQPAGSTGTLILRNDNPSGDPARDKSVSIPVTF
jgi:hypothetical protein